MAKENLLKTPAIVSLANFQRIQMLRHPRFAFHWLSVSFFDYWPIRMSGLLLLCTELTLFCIELPENCIYLNQSELSNFFMYIIRPEKKKFRPVRAWRWFPIIICGACCIKCGAFCIVCGEVSIISVTLHAMLLPLYALVSMWRTFYIYLYLLNIYIHVLFIWGTIYIYIICGAAT